MKGDEPELSGMAAGPGDQHPLRVEERTELGVGRSLASCRFDDCGRAELDQRIHCDGRTVSGDDQWIHVDADDVGPFGDQRRQRQQHRSELAAINFGFAAELAEQLLCRQLLDHLRGIDRADRRRAELHIGNCLGNDATDTQHHGGSELWVADDPGDELAIAGNHRRDQQRDGTVVRSGGGQ